MVRAAVLLLQVVGVPVILTAAIYGLLEAERATRQAEAYQQPVRFELINAPEELHDIVQEHLADLAAFPWIDPQLCRRVHERLQELAWIRRIEAVGKAERGVVYVSCQYRQPAAMVQHGDFFYLVDFEGVRLPGQYALDSRWLIIQGLSKPPPEPGRPWLGGDAAAAVRLVELLMAQPYAGQIAALSMYNYRGRLNLYEPQIELISRGRRSRIIWGSAPGEETEENSAAQKLAILAENHRDFGRIDANLPAIDISVFSDRFVVPTRTAGEAADPASSRT